MNKKKLKGWQVWFIIDEKIRMFSSENYQWNEIPQTGLLIIKRIFQDDSCHLISGYDQYSLEDDYISTDKNIKKGKAISDKDFWDLYNGVKCKCLLM